MTSGTDGRARRPFNGCRADEQLAGADEAVRGLEPAQCHFDLVPDDRPLVGGGASPTVPSDSLPRSTRLLPSIGTSRTRLSNDRRPTSTIPRCEITGHCPVAALVCGPLGRVGRHPEAEERLRRSNAATSQSPVATAILHRAIELASGNRDALATHARTFARLGCLYQQRRTEALLDG